VIYDSETWLTKADHEIKMDRNEISMIRWMCEFYSERKKNAKVGESLGLEPVSSAISKRRLKRFGHAGCKDVDWITSAAMDVDGVR